MLLIADAGSTKIEWCMVSDHGAREAFTTTGINALMLNEAELRAEFGKALGNLPAAPEAIYYYGAGCIGGEVNGKVARALPHAHRKEVESDMLGAARALLGHGSGLALILGTGSNSALYNGSALTANMPPMGYIIGDEGSGAALGKRLLREAYRCGTLRRELEEYAGLDYAGIIERVYRQPAANRFLASMVPFIAANSNELAPLITEEFNAMFAALKRHYGTAHTVSATGGTASALEPFLRECALSNGFNINKIQERPMAGLIEYHTK